MFGIRDAKVRERLLHEFDLTLKTTDEICHAAESMVAQVKVVDDSLSTAVNNVKTENHPPQKKARPSENAGTVDDDMSCIRGNYALPMVKPATSAMSRTILQPSAVANLPLRLSRLLRMMKCFRHTLMVLA